MDRRELGKQLLGLACATLTRFYPAPPAPKVQSMHGWHECEEHTVLFTDLTFDEIKRLMETMVV